MTMISTQPNAITAPWFAVLQALAGAHPSAFWGNESQDAYEDRELLKKEAQHWIKQHQAKHPLYRAPYWLLHCYAHWWRAANELDGKWDATVYDEAFPEGMDFKKYLSAWIWSVGVPQLKMPPQDVQAVYEMTGVAAVPHELMPVGKSMFNNPAQV